jgi:oligogalacturonide lyase
MIVLILYMAMALGAALEPATKAHATEYRDERTGARVRDLTPGMAQANVVYQTHPMWTSGMEYLIFNAERGGKVLPHALQMKTGQARVIIEGDVGASVLDPRLGRLYCVMDKQIDALDVAAAFEGEAKPRKVADLPEKALRLEGGISLDSRGDLLYAGALLEEQKKWALFALNVANGGWRTVTEIDFRIGHVQANPAVPRVIMFCHETGGDAPQRTWVVNADGAGLRPFYQETYKEWVTHEVWWGGTRALFTVWPYDDEHKKQPHGVLTADLATGKPTVHAQFPAWHTHGSPDGQWIVADDFDRNLWLIRAESNERRLLTQGHLGKGFDTHPHPSFTPDSKAVVFTSSKSGRESIFMVDVPAWDSLPLP